MSRWPSGSILAGVPWAGPTNTSTRSPPPRDDGGSRAPGSQAAGLPQPGILGRLIDAMRTAPRGVVGWRLCPAKLDRQPAFLAWALLAQPTAAAAPHTQLVHMQCTHPITRMH